MDKQTNILSNTKNLIPVNTRTIGTPEGIYILYLEDYVHTFIKKILTDKNSKTISFGTDAEYQIEKEPQPNIALFGRCIEEDGRYRLVISGAAVLDNNNNKVQQYNDTYFPSCAYIGIACVSYNKDSKLRFELTLSNTTVILDDFYIYYDQNEEMQNYLIEWNADKEKDRDKENVSTAEQGVRIRNHVDDAARLGRIAQAYNREEAKVSFMWNVMNVLCLGFVVCIMAFGISSVNNYNKMQNMQEKIDYCMAFVEENTSFDLHKFDEAQTAAVIQQNVQSSDEENAAESSTMQQSTQIVSEAINTETTNTETASPETANTETANNTETATSETTNAETMNTETTTSETTNAETSGAEAAEALAQPAAEEVQSEAQIQTDGQQEKPKQYYIVRKGDTLRTICYDIYGDYSHVDEICQWNNIEDPDNILYGQKLLLP